ncbi:MAG: hypothetical protein JJE25_02160 [Bacteroidia bacterium]|nr:hypothetical protein [Bacteroidia bacterium]
MKKYFICFISAILPVLLFAQPNKEKLESLKIGFLTERLKLTPDEAKVFWPVYNQFQDELEKVRKQRRETFRNPNETFDDISDRDLEKMIDNEIILRQNELDIMKKYNPQFKQVLPIRKVALLYKTEEDFKRKLLTMISERKAERRNK